MQPHRVRHVASLRPHRVSHVIGPQCMRAPITRVRVPASCRYTGTTSRSSCEGERPPSTPSLHPHLSIATRRSRTHDLSQPLFCSHRPPTPRQRTQGAGRGRSEGGAARHRAQCARAVGGGECGGAGERAEHVADASSASRRTNPRTAALQRRPSTSAVRAPCVASVHRVVLTRLRSQAREEAIGTSPAFTRGGNKGASPGPHPTMCPTATLRVLVG